jgi:hypothetical protein
MEIAEPPWQHRILINGRAAAEREAYLGDAQACIGDPYGSLSTFRHEGFVPQSARQVNMETSKMTSNDKSICHQDEG